LSVVFEEVHAGVGTAAILLEADKVLGLLDKLMMISSSWSRPRVTRGCQIEIIRLITLPIPIDIL